MIKRINVAKRNEIPMVKAGKFGISKPSRGNENVGIPNSNVGNVKSAVKCIRKYNMIIPIPIKHMRGKKQHRNRHALFKSVLSSLAKHPFFSIPINLNAK